MWLGCTVLLPWPWLVWWVFANLLDLLMTTVFLLPVLVGLLEFSYMLVLRILIV